MSSSETWLLTHGALFRLASFDRKIFRKIYGIIRKDEEWRIRYNRDLYELYRLPDIMISIRVARLRWPGQVQRMNEKEEDLGKDGLMEYWNM